MIVKIVNLNSIDRFDCLRLRLPDMATHFSFNIFMRYIKSDQYEHCTREIYIKIGNHSELLLFLFGVEKGHRQRDREGQRNLFYVISRNKRYLFKEKKKYE